MTNIAYDTDYYSWTQDQASRLRRAAHERVNTDIDWEHIAEEIEDMGRRQRDEMESRLTTILEHLLKLAYSSLTEPQRQWGNTVRTQRRSLERLLDKNPSLRRLLPDMLAGAYEEAVARVEPNRIDLTMDHLPTECPFDLDSQILVTDWLPEPPFR